MRAADPQYKVGIHAALVKQGFSFDKRDLGDIVTKSAEWLCQYSPQTQELIDMHNDPPSEARGMNTLHLYYRQIAQIPLLTGAQERELAASIEAGLFAQERLNNDVETLDEQLRLDLQSIADKGLQDKQRFTEANTRLIISNAIDYVRRNPDINLVDLVLAGNEKLIRAVEGFDFMKGWKFSTYMRMWMQNAYRQVRAQVPVISRSWSVQEKLASYGMVQRELENELGRPATYAEIAKAVDEDENAVRDVYYHSRPAKSLDTVVELRDGSLSSLGYLIADSRAADTRDQDLREHVEKALQGLSQAEQQIIHYRYFAKRRLSYVAISKILDIKRSGRIAQVAFNKLKHPASGLAPYRNEFYNETPSWREQAACLEIGVQPFFSGALYSQAQATCQKCPVMALCAEYASQQAKITGVWGGTTWPITAKEVMKVKSERSSKPAAPKIKRPRKVAPKPETSAPVRKPAPPPVPAPVTYPRIPLSLRLQREAAAAEAARKKAVEALPFTFKRE